ncbi:Organic cation/carnitine transporter 7 [Citrus sinensis]|nr:Organic cation/carnitine transporter 7 [Citrus sinensis]
MAEQGHVYTVDEALTHVGFGKYQCFVLAYAGLGWVAEAMEIMILSFVGPTVKSEWNLSSTEESLITTSVFAGLVDGLSGRGAGSGHVFLSWFLEFVPPSNRGMWMVIFSSFWTIGSVSEAIGAWIIMPRLDWRWLLGLSSIPSFILLAFLGFQPESPRYLCLKGRTAEAHRALEKIAQVNKTKLPNGKLVAHRSTLPTGERAPPELVHLLSSNGGNKTTEGKSGLSLFLMLFSSKLARTTILLWLLLFGNSFAYYAVVLLISELSSLDTRCRSPLMFSHHPQDANLYIDEFITSLAEIPGLLLAAILVDTAGRKLSITIMFTLSCLFLLPLVTYQSNILTTGLLFGARMCVMGAFTVSLIYAAEVKLMTLFTIYPTSVRSTGAGAANAMGRIGGMVCPLVAVALVANCHQMTAVVLLVVVIVTSILSVMLIPFETKGQELSDTVDFTSD